MESLEISQELEKALVEPEAALSPSLTNNAQGFGSPEQLASPDTFAGFSIKQPEKVINPAWRRFTTTRVSLSTFYGATKDMESGLTRSR